MSNRAKMMSPPASLNNRGVLLLEAGRFADAADSFKKASKMLIAIMSRKSSSDQNKSKRQAAAAAQDSSSTGQLPNNPLPPNRDEETTGSSSEQISTSPLLPTNDGPIPAPNAARTPIANSTSSAADPQQSPALVVVATSNRLARRPVTAVSGYRGQENVSAKRARIDKGVTSINRFDAALCTTNSAAPPHEQQVWHNLGRPLWIQSPHQRKEPLQTGSLSATILYNLGLCFHLSAVARQRMEGNTRRSTIDSTKTVVGTTYNRALEFYKMSSEIMVRHSMSRKSLSSPVLAVTLQNTALIHTALEEPQLAVKYQRQLAGLLRMMGATTSRETREKDYENFLVRLLTLPKATALAAAA